MMCHRIGRSPMLTIGLGRDAVSSESRVPRPPARITTFTSRQPPRCLLAPPGAPVYARHRPEPPAELTASAAPGTRLGRTVQVERLAGTHQEVLPVGGRVLPDEDEAGLVERAVRDHGAGAERRPQVVVPRQPVVMRTCCLRAGRVHADPLVAGVNGLRRVAQRHGGLARPPAGRVVGERIRGDGQGDRDEPREGRVRECYAPAGSGRPAETAQEQDRGGRDHGVDVAVIQGVHRAERREPARIEHQEDDERALGASGDPHDHRAAPRRIRRRSRGAAHGWRASRRGSPPAGPAAVPGPRRGRDDAPPVSR